jgi:hypothetical protein
MTPAPLLLLAAVVATPAALLFQHLRPRFGSPRPSLAPPKGSARAGVLYAFTLAFAPTAKETASRHLPSYLAGIGYHLAIFAMMARLLASLVHARIPAALEAAFAALFAAGIACGIGLLAKRISVPSLAAISVPEDFLANLLASAALAAGLAASLSPALLPVFQVAGAVLLLYAPLGKLRHMGFLLSSRRAVGAHFGRRGVRPAARPIVGARG